MKSKNRTREAKKINIEKNPTKRKTIQKRDLKNSKNCENVGSEIRKSKIKKFKKRKRIHKEFKKFKKSKNCEHVENEIQKSNGKI